VFTVDSQRVCIPEVDVTVKLIDYAEHPEVFKEEWDSLYCDIHKEDSKYYVRVKSSQDNSQYLSR